MQIQNTTELQHKTPAEWQQEAGSFSTLTLA